MRKLNAPKGSFPGWRTMTGAERYNARMAWICEEARRLEAAKHGRPCACPNCSWTGPEDQVRPDIPDLAERVSAGETMPVGECPKCGALCHYVARVEDQGQALAELGAVHIGTPDYDRIVTAARREYATDELEIDDNPMLSRAPDDGGVWVAAWVWVSTADIQA
jgi:predicted RNA-binding Zn-ribbon protein involved in translation (DUF1610 family)